jgi:hypothetical protein
MRQWGLKALPVDLCIAPPSIAILTLKNRTLSPVAQLLGTSDEGALETEAPIVSAVSGPWH